MKVQPQPAQSEQQVQQQVQQLVQQQQQPAPRSQRLSQHQAQEQRAPFSQNQQSLQQQIQQLQQQYLENNASGCKLPDINLYRKNYQQRQRPTSHYNKPSIRKIESIQELRKKYYNIEAAREVLANIGGSRRGVEAQLNGSASPARKTRPLSAKQSSPSRNVSKDRDASQRHEHEGRSMMQPKPHRSQHQHQSQACLEEPSELLEKVNRKERQILGVYQPAYLNPAQRERSNSRGKHGLQRIQSEQQQLLLHNMGKYQGCQRQKYRYNKENKNVRYSYENKYQAQFHGQKQNNLSSVANDYSANAGSQQENCDYNSRRPDDSACCRNQQDQRGQDAPARAGHEPNNAYYKLNARQYRYANNYNYGQPVRRVY